MSGFTIAPVTDEARAQITLLTHLHGLALEINTGLNLSSRGPALSTVIKRRWGFKGNKHNLLVQLLALMQAADPTYVMSASIRKAMDK
jgi:hypothetical protein